MLGNFSGPMLLITIAIVLIVLAAIATGIIIWAVKASTRNRQTELDAAYQAGRESQS